MSRDVSRARRDAIPCAYNILCSFMISDSLKDCKVYTSTHKIMHFVLPSGKDPQ